MITWIIVVVLYIASVIFCRWINYYAYVRGIDKDVAPGVWITPFFNILGIIVELRAIAVYNKWKLSEWGPIGFLSNMGHKFLNSLVGRDWDEKKWEYKTRKEIEEKIANEWR